MRDVIEKEEKFLWLVSLCPNTYFSFIAVETNKHTHGGRRRKKQDYYLEFLLLVLSHVSSLEAHIN